MQFKSMKYNNEYLNNCKKNLKKKNYFLQIFGILDKFKKYCIFMIKI